MTPKINYIDLFSGIGGFAQGLSEAGISFENHFFSEIDKTAISIYQRHFPKTKGLGNVTAIRNFSQFKKIDLVTFGFPCQDLSIAGKGRGLAGNRSGLFFETMRIIKELKPTYFIFENVKGLLTNNRGADFVRCLRENADNGIYDCEWQLVNTCWLLPQNRERIYFIGHLRGKSAPKIFPIFESNTNFTGIQAQSAKDRTTKGDSTNGTYVVEHQQLQKVRQINKTEKNHQQDRVYSLGAISPCLNTGTGGNLQPKIVLGTLDNIDIRRLTPLEYERLQGFPDGWTEFGADGKKISDSARYKTLGNAVSVPIVSLIAKRLFL